ncbi:MAG: ribosome maturation factor RimP [Atopobiaceae bacterium]|nr:ribosome maturation factor RimP [Atopobiaceae bacterium]
MAGDIRERLIEALEAVAPDHGMDIVDVDIMGAGRQSVVCVRLDRAEPTDQSISLDEVAAQSRWVADIVEAIDPFSGSYVLEVSSPGLDRPLRREKDFVRFAGETISLTTTATEGRRRYTGELEGFEDGCILISCDGRTERVPLELLKSAKIKPVIDFSAKSEKN